MKTIKLDRRSFLKVSGLAGGGLMLAFNWGCTTDSVKEIEEVIGLEANAFIKIATNGIVTIMSPNPEIGQGVKTSMPMIVAEELDVNWDNVRVEQAHLNTEIYTRQLAGGSQSIRQGWESLRMAGAMARRMLLEAAAKEWSVPVGELTTSEGVINHASSGKSISYGEISSKAQGIEVPEELELKDPKDFKIIGTGRRNVDVEKIATGQPLYGIDHKKPGMLIAMIEHPPAFGMKLKSFDAASIKSMPGIKDVFSINIEPEGVEKQWSDTNAFPELVAIVGETTWQVMKAKKALKVEWERITPAENSDEHENKLTALLEKPANDPARVDGDPAAAFKTADKVVEKTYSAPFLAHNTMEPMNFFAHVTADKAELMGPVQTPEFLRKTVAGVLGMEESQVSIGMTRMGGGFGRRLYGHFGTEAALISQKMNAPVKMIYKREDDMTQGTYRPAYKVTYKAAIKDNQMVAMSVTGVGSNEGPVFVNRFPAGTIDNYSATNSSMESNISTGAWRAPRSNFMACAEQSFLDEVAEACEKDPIQFRLDLFERAKTDPVGEDNDYDAARYAGVLEKVRDMSGWGEEKPGVHRGVSAYFCHNSYVAQVIDIEIVDNKPKIQKVWCAVDCGIVINTMGALNQIEGGIIDGIGHGMYSRLTFKDGAPEQSNFNTYKLIRHREAPGEIETQFVENEIHPTGLGEPSLPPVQGALANALYRATGKRLYNQPFIDELESADVKLGEIG